MGNLASDQQSTTSRGSVRRPLLWLALGFTVGSACLIALTLNYLRSQTIASGTRLTQSFAQVIEEQTTRTIQTIDQRLQLATVHMAQLDAAGQLNEQTARQLLRQQVKELPFVRAMWVMDAQGRIRYDSDEGNIGVSLADRPYFQIYVTQPRTGFHLGTPVRSRSTGTWLVSAARPLHTSQGGFAGIIVAAVEPPYFDKLWHAIDLGADGSIALFRSDGVLMMRSPFKDDVMGQKFPDTALFSQYLPASPNGSYLNHSAIDGTLRTFAYRTLSAQPALVVVVGQSFDLLLAPWRHLASLALAIWVAASAAVVFLCVFLDRAWQQRVRAEASAALFAQRLALATEAASIGVWDWDLIADQWYASPTYFTLLGYEHADGPSGRAAWFDWVHPDDRTAVAQAIASAVNGGDAPYQYEARMRHADDTWRWIAVVGKVVERNADGHATRMRGVTLDMTERRRAEAALGESRARLEALTRRLLEVQEAERRMIARELHDEVGSVLTAVKLNLQALRRARSDAQREDALADGLALVEGAIQSVRSLSLDLRPSMLDDLGLIPALKWYCERQAQRAGVVIELALDAIDLKAAAQLETACFRIVQEALTNAVRHAQARRIEVALRRGDGQFVLEVSDDGVGFDAKAARVRGLAGESGGLLGMAERVNLLGGRFGIDSTPGGGTRVWAEFVMPEGGFA